MATNDKGRDAPREWGNYLNKIPEEVRQISLDRAFERYDHVLALYPGRHEAPSIGATTGVALLDFAARLDWHAAQTQEEKTKAFALCADSGFAECNRYLMSIVGSRIYVTGDDCLQNDFVADHLNKVVGEDKFGAIVMLYGDKVAKAATAWAKTRSDSSRVLSALDFEKAYLSHHPNQIVAFTSDDNHPILATAKKFGMKINRVSPDPRVIMDSRSGFSQNMAHMPA